MLRHIKDIISKEVLKQKNAWISCTARLWQGLRRFIHQNSITITIAFLSIGLCSLTLYILIFPLPDLPVPNFADEGPITSNDIQARFIAPIETYTGLLKTRDLFKPSIPIPSEKKIGKTTAQQLAQRLQFLGTSGDENNLSALVFIPERGPGSFQVDDRVAEFILIDVKKDSLVLELENEQITLKR
jgi:hypothetical protein